MHFAKKIQRSILASMLLCLLLISRKVKKHLSRTSPNFEAEIVIEAWIRVRLGGQGGRLGAALKCQFVSTVITQNMLGKGTYVYIAFSLVCLYICSVAVKLKILVHCRSPNFDFRSSEVDLQDM